MPADTPCVNEDVVEQMRQADAAMGQDLDALFEMIDGPAKEQFNCANVIINHKWNDN